MPIVSVGQITIVDVNDGVDGLDGPALQIISSAAGFTYQDGVASPADQTISFTLLRQGLDNTEANWAASGVTLETNKDRIDITEYIFGLPGTGDGDTAYLTLAQFGTARQMSIGATVGSLAAYANVLRIGDSTAQAGATRNVLTGDWVTATAYDVGDIVVKEGFRWVCIVAHISSGSIMPPVFPTTANTYWRLYGARGALTTSRAIAGSSWLDAEAVTAIADAGGVAPIQGDVVTLFNTTAGYSETRIRSSAGPWTALSVIFGGNVIVDNTLTASKIQASAITTDKLAANAITASKIAVGDFAVQARNWNFEEGDTQWTKETGWSIVSDAVNAKSGNWVARFTGTSVAALRNSQFVPAEAGEAFYAEAYCKHAAGSSGVGSRVRIQFRNAAGADLAFAQGNLIGGGTTSYTRSFIQGIAPANTAAVRVEATSQLTTGTSYVDEVRLFRASNATLIADGAITTDKLTANAVTTEKLAAGAVTANEIASNAITANKIAAGAIAVGTAAIETGAITTFMLGDGTITNAKIATVSAEKLTTGSVGVGENIQSTNYVAGSTGWQIQGNGGAEFSNVTVRGQVVSSSISGGTIDGSVITGATLRTASSGQRIEMDTSGLLFLSGATSGKYGQFKYGARKYGSGVLVFFNNASRRVPFYVAAEQNVADIHLYNRGANPTGGTYEAGDMIVVNGRLRIFVPALGGWRQVALEP